MNYIINCLTETEKYFFGMCKMTFQVGYQDNRALIEYLLKHCGKVSEVYFPWGDFTTGRGVIPSETVKQNLTADLKRFSDAGIRLCLLLNGNCYGRHDGSDTR